MKTKPRRKAPSRTRIPSTTLSGNLALHRQLVRLLRGDGAHLSYADVLRDYPARWAKVKIPGVPHTPWQILEHLRIAQKDMMEFSRDPAHASPSFPEGYWPATAKPRSAAAWKRSVAAFLRDLDAFITWVSNPRTDLLTDMHGGEGPPLLREAFLIADHNAYHLGQLVQIRRMLEAEKS